MKTLMTIVMCALIFVLSFFIFFLLITFIQVNLIPREFLEQFLSYLSLSGDGPLTEWFILSGVILSLLLAITACREVYLLCHPEI